VYIVKCLCRCDCDGKSLRFISSN